MKNYKIIVLFGCLLAFLAVMLQFFEYKYFIGSLDTSVYTSVVATVFTIVGVWVGMNILKTKKETDTSNAASVSINNAPIQEGTISDANLKALNLNDREYEILQLIAKGHSNKEIAKELFLAIPTIKTHTSNLYSKLDVRSRTQAVHKAREMRIL